MLLASVDLACGDEILTIGAMIGAVTSGNLADILGRKMVK